MHKKTAFRIAFVANTAWNLWNFRHSLLEMLGNDEFELVCLAPEDGFQEKLRGIKNLRFIPLKHLSRKSLSPFGNLQTLREIAGMLRREKPDLAIFYTVKPNIFGSLAARLAGIPAVASVEGMGYAATASPFLGRLIFALYRLAFRFVKKVVFLNHDDQAEFLRRSIVPIHKTLVIKGTGVDINYFRPTKESVQSSVFLYIGRLLSDKGIREFVQAARQVKENATEARFQILGSPDADNPASIEPEELRHWVENQQIEYLGQTDDVRPFIARASVVVLPSYREGMPRALLEGMAMGKPVITTDSVGCRDTVEEGKNGFIVPSENAEALASAMSRFLQLSPEVQDAMGRHSRQKAVAEFSNETVLPQYRQLLLDTLLEANKSR